MSRLARLFMDRCCVLVLALWCLMLLDERRATGALNYDDEDDDDGDDDHSEDFTISDEKLLIKYLLSRYEEYGIVGRPVYNTSITIKVDFGIGLIQILDLDERNQILTTNVWCRYMWKDIFMRWDPMSFGGVLEVRVPASRIWTPDIVLYNYADVRLKEHREAMIVVSHDGSVLWIPPAIFKSTCSIDITNFPFDVQTCEMKFGSWTYDGFKLDINFYHNESEVDINDYVHSNEWALVGHPAKKNVKYYSCCVEPYPDLTFSVQLKRVAAFYHYILVLPCVLLSFLTLVIFWLPPESPAKILLGMNIFVAFFVLLLVLAESTPPASPTIPLIGAYFCINMILITLSTFLAVIVITTHIRGDKKNKVPDWLRQIAVVGLARALCMGEFLDAEAPKPPERQTGATTSSSATAMATDDGHSRSKRRSKSSSSRRGNPSSTATSTSAAAATADSFISPTPVAAASAPQDSGAAAAAFAVGATATTHHHHHQHQQQHHHPPVFDFRQQQTTATPFSAAGECFFGGVGGGGGGEGPSSAFAPIQNAKALQSDIKEIRRIIKAYVGRIQDKDVQAKVTKEWRIVARVLDRLFFLLYVSTIIISLASIFPKG